MSGRLRILCLGGCNLRQPIASTAWPEAGESAGPPFFTYTLGEMRQALAGYRGELTIPTNLLRLCNLTRESRPRPETSPLGAFDIALVEPNTSVEIILDGIHVNRRPIWRLTSPLRALGPHAVKALVRWYEKGLHGLDEVARRDGAAELLPLVPSEWPSAGLIERLLRGAASQSPPVEPALAALTEELRRPVGVVLFNWSYMPDGRALSWPAGFRAEVVAAAEKLGLRVFDPTDLIRQTGVETALEKDRRHYTRPFTARMAEPLASFAAAVAEDGAARGGRQRGRHRP